MVWLDKGIEPQVYRLQSGRSNHYAVALDKAVKRLFIKYSTTSFAVQHRVPKLYFRPPTLKYKSEKKAYLQSKQNYQAFFIEIKFFKVTFIDFRLRTKVKTSFWRSNFKIKLFNITYEPQKVRMTSGVFMNRIQVLRARLEYVEGKELFFEINIWNWEFFPFWSSSRHIFFFLDALLLPRRLGELFLFNPPKRTSARNRTWGWDPKFGTTVPAQR